MQQPKSIGGLRAGLTALIAPRHIAVIGASNDPARIGGRPLRYLMEAGFAGAIYPVNPQRKLVQGLPSFADIADVPGPVDCAIIALPAKFVAATLERCAASGVKSAIIFSSGFAEIGAAGRQLQDQLRDIAKRKSIRVLGPNSIGILNFQTRGFATFSSTGDAGYPQAGSLAIISQSGAYGTHLYAVARQWGLGVSHVISTGNECDVDVAECISWAAEQESVKVIAAYAEGGKNGDELIAALEKARQNRKPVIFMKVGTSAVGAAAAVSHTASLAGSDEIYNAVFAQCGVYRASTSEDMLDVAYAATPGIYPKGRRLGLITISGGVGAQMADYANKLGFDVAPMPEQAQASLKAVLPYAAPRNPIDVTAQVFNDIELLGNNFSILLEEGGYDVLVAFFSMVAASPYIVDELVRELKALRERYPDQLILLSLVGAPEIVTRYREAGYLVFEDPCRAISAAAALVGFAESFARTGRRSVTRNKTIPDRPLNIRKGSLSEWESRQLLAQAGVPVVGARLVHDAEAAIAAAAEFKGPVAVKVNGADFKHKSDIGGVVLDVKVAEDVGKIFGELSALGERHGSAAKPEGVIVAPMVAGVIETILGIKIDPVFGPAILFGLGGIHAELFGDFAIRLAPVDHEVARSMIGQIKGAGLLQGARGTAPADVEALADALVRLSEFAAGHAKELASVDINPLLVLPEGQGVVALDCLIVGAGEFY